MAELATTDEKLKAVWTIGDPPHIGWWNTRVLAMPAPDLWGWWDGERWSAFAHESEGLKKAVAQAKKRGYCTERGVEWSNYYPADARVPRVAP